MSERINELIELAYEQKPLMVPNPETFEIEHKIGHGGIPMYHRAFNREKFAELLVRECIDIVTTTEIEGNDNARLRGEIATRIAKTLRS